MMKIIVYFLIFGIFIATSSCAKLDRFEKDLENEESSENSLNENDENVESIQPSIQIRAHFDRYSKEHQKNLTKAPSIKRVPLKLSFSCKGRSPGYYADMENKCQVYHVCKQGGEMLSFVCPNSTTFNQEIFACDWWFNHDCKRASDYYYLNAKMYQQRLEEIDSGKSEEVDEDEVFESSQEKIKMIEENTFGKIMKKSEDGKSLNSGGFLTIATQYMNRPRFQYEKNNDISVSDVKLDLKKLNKPIKVTHIKEDSSGEISKGKAFPIPQPVQNARISSFEAHKLTNMGNNESDKSKNAAALQFFMKKKMSNLDSIESGELKDKSDEAEHFFMKKKLMQLSPQEIKKIKEINFDLKKSNVSSNKSNTASSNLSLNVSEHGSDLLKSSQRSSAINKNSLHLFLEAPKSGKLTDLKGRKINEISEISKTLEVPHRNRGKNFDHSFHNIHEYSKGKTPFDFFNSGIDNFESLVIPQNTQDNFPHFVQSFPVVHTQSSPNHANVEYHFEIREPQHFDSNFNQNSFISHENLNSHDIVSPDALFIDNHQDHHTQHISNDHQFIEFVDNHQFINQVSNNPHFIDHVDNNHNSNDQLFIDHGDDHHILNDHQIINHVDNAQPFFITNHDTSSFIDNNQPTHSIIIDDNNQFINDGGHSTLFLGDIQSNINGHVHDNHNHIIHNNFNHGNSFDLHISPEDSSSFLQQMHLPGTEIEFELVSNDNNNFKDDGHSTTFIDSSFTPDYGSFISSNVDDNNNFGSFITTNTFPITDSFITTSNFDTNSNDNGLSNSFINGDSFKNGGSFISGDSIVSGDSFISGDSIVSGDSFISGDSIVSGDSFISGDSIVSGDSFLSGDSIVSGDSFISGDSFSNGNSFTSGDSVIINGDSFNNQIQNTISIGGYLPPTNEFVSSGSIQTFSDNNNNGNIIFLNK